MSTKHQRVTRTPQIRSRHLNQNFPRPKIDLDALRQDADSFREVSTHNVRKTLESHDMRKERSGLAGRRAVTAVMGLMAVFVAGANIMGATEYPILVWGLIFCSVLAVAEQCRRMLIVRSRVREMTEPIAASAHSRDADDQSVAGDRKILQIVPARNRGTPLSRQRKRPATPSRTGPVRWPPTPMKQTRNPPHNSCLPPAVDRGLTLQEIGRPA